VPFRNPIHHFLECGSRESGTSKEGTSEPHTSECAQHNKTEKKIWDLHQAKVREREREREREEKENQSVLVRESKRVVSSLSRLCLTLFPYFDIGCVVVMPDSEMTLSHVSMSRFEEYGIVPNYNVPLSDVADSISTHLT
jgi:hypothetical protein